MTLRLVCFLLIFLVGMQCTKGHISCSGCCTDGAMADECECLMCREPETATRCRAMERVLAGVSVPCPFRQHGCAEMIPYASKEAHEGSCRYAPCHRPIPSCTGYAGKSLVDHVQVDHPDVHRTRVKPGCLTALRMRSSEQARMLWLDNCAELLLVAGTDVPGGRSLSIVWLMDELFEVEDELKYRIEVVGKDGVLSLSGPTKGVERFDRPYQASAFLFVPNAIWDSHPEDIPVFIHLK
ncbi:E3 ubiquitin-protein ligase SINA-like 2 [Panicum hallii]|uniref:E3 ubiquitin-protein ligase SINA-like 2 n=1 Tax=Panicum hallii TaxID=206008 RepID=UPI000DF4D070|nr:E3 ubiquitin-protein ligase SINA-like 2 [Panicum hallii]